MRLSVVVTSFNQARYLVDALESLAVQSSAPDEVIVVDDGSTEAETLELLDRLPHYHYPFPLKVVRRPNGGVSAARNTGFEHFTGDAVIPLDGDDILLPSAVQDFRRFLEDRPDVDVVYPDLVAFGTERGLVVSPSFNRWRLTQGNVMICASAIRRRVIEQGYVLDEALRYHGCEDWELWMRACALGPFTAAPLGTPAFGYRKWGHSQLTYVEIVDSLERMRRLHSEQGIWSPDVDRRLRTAEAPAHCFLPGPSTAAAEGDAPPVEERDDYTVVPPAGVDDFLRSDGISRFLWFGDVDPRASSLLQVAVQEIGGMTPRPAYVLVRAGEDLPFAVVVDRLSAQRRGIATVAGLFGAGDATATLRLRGTRVPAVVGVGLEPLGDEQRARVRDLLGPLERSATGSWFPDDLADARRSESFWWFLTQRSPRIPGPGPGARPSDRRLAVFLPWLEYGGAEFAVRNLLKSRALRARFDSVQIVTLTESDHPAHAQFEGLVDGIVHLGSLGLYDVRIAQLAHEFLASAGITDLLLVNALAGYELLPLIREEGPKVWAVAQLHGFDWDPAVQAPTVGFPRLVASDYAALLDRVATVSEGQADRLRDLFYFPASKIRSVHLGVDQQEFAPPSTPGPAPAGRVLWCGRLAFQKDPLLAVDVFEELLRRRGDVECVFVGEGPMQDELVHRLAGSSAADRLRLSPFTDDVGDLMRSVDCLFLTSVYEDIPIVVMEAASTGLPVVMPWDNTAVGEMDEHASLLQVHDRTNVAEYVDLIEKALARGRSVPSTYLSHERYGEELISWLFPAERTPSDPRRAVFGSAGS